MTDNSDKVAIATERAQGARTRMDQTLMALQDRLRPRTLARDAASSLTETGERAARATVESIKTRPAITVAGVAAIGLLLTRHRLAGLFRRKH